MVEKNSIGNSMEKYEKITRTTSLVLSYRLPVRMKWWHIAQASNGQIDTGATK